MRHRHLAQGLQDPRICEIRPRRLLQERGRGLTKDLDSCQFLVSFNTASEEVGHVVFDSSYFHSGVGQGSLEVHMVAPKKQPHLPRLVGLDVFPDQVPSSLEIVGWPAQLEIVHVDDQVELQLGMPEATSPARYRDKTCLTEVRLAVFFPVPAAVGMTVQREHQRAHGIVYTLPAFWPLFAR